MVGKIIKKVKENKVLILVFILAITATGYYLFYYQSPEMCFSDNVYEWSKRNKPPQADKWERQDKFPAALLTNDPNIVTAYAKTYLREYNIDDMDTGYRNKLYMALGTYMEYCKVK